MNLTSSSKSTVDEDGMLVVFGENNEDGNGSSWTSRSSVVNYTISTELFGKRNKLMKTDELSYIAISWSSSSSSSKGTTFVDIE